MQSWWIYRLAEAAALAAVVGIPATIWFVGKLLPRLDRQQHWSLIELTMALGPILIAGLGMAASMFFFATHDEGGAPSGEDYLHAGLAFLGPIIIWPVAFIAWAAALNSGRKTPSATGEAGGFNRPTPARRRGRFRNRG